MIWSISVMIGFWKLEGNAIPTAKIDLLRGPTPFKKPGNHCCFGECDWGFTRKFWGGKFLDSKHWSRN